MPRPGSDLLSSTLCYLRTGGEKARQTDRCADWVTTPGSPRPSYDEAVGGTFVEDDRKFAASCSKHSRRTSRAWLVGSMGRAEKPGGAEWALLGVEWPADTASSKSARRSTGLPRRSELCRPLRHPRRRSIRKAFPPPLADKVYYTYTRTDGDGMNFWRQVYWDLWDQPSHGKVPVGWQTGPTSSDLIPTSSITSTSTPRQRRVRQC